MYTDTCIISTLIGLFFFQYFPTHQTLGQTNPHKITTCCGLIWTVPGAFTVTQFGLVFVPFWSFHWDYGKMRRYFCLCMIKVCKMCKTKPALYHTLKCVCLVAIIIYSIVINDPPHLKMSPWGKSCFWNTLLCPTHPQFTKPLFTGSKHGSYRAGPLYNKQATTPSNHDIHEPFRFKRGFMWTNYWSMWLKQNTTQNCVFTLYYHFRQGDAVAQWCQSPGDSHISRLVTARSVARWQSCQPLGNSHVSHSVTVMSVTQR